jgi:4-hydroxyacetophenone monooxygenase
MFTDWITSQVSDPDLLAKVVPDYPATGKRTLQDNGSWLRALQRDNVELVRTGIDRIEADAIVTEDGRRHEVDIVVYATGFHANRFLWPMEIVGRDGAVLADQWGDSPSAYLGITVPNFPNFFCMYGPGTNLAHGGSLIFHSECQMSYIGGCIDELVSGGLRAIEVRQDVHDAYQERYQKEIDSMVWSSPAIRHTWYKGPDGRIHLLSPWPLGDYWRWTKAPERDDFLLR